MLQNFGPPSGTVLSSHLFLSSTVLIGVFFFHRYPNKVATVGSSSGAPRGHLATSKTWVRDLVSPSLSIYMVVALVSQMTSMVEVSVSQTTSMVKASVSQTTSMVEVLVSSYVVIVMLISVKDSVPTITGKFGFHIN